MKNTFAEYCKAQFRNAKEGAAYFGLDQSSYNKYVQLVRFPRPDRLARIVRDSKGQICVTKWIEAFNKQREIRKKLAELEGGKA
jgi:hypothetical protein